MQEFLSYGRLVKPTQQSAGRVLGHSGRRIGNAHLKWAYSEAAVCFLRANPRGQAMLKKLSERYGKPKAMSILAAKLARATYFMLKRKVPFEAERFYRT